MKKSLSILTGSLLVLSMLFSINTTASAIPITPPSQPDPVVTPVSGDMDFATTVVSIVALPGTTNFGLLPVPVGFPAGEAQYGGDGVRVSGMDSGKATACFSIATVKINQGWDGKIAVWNGVKWVKLATTITPLDESPNSLACATITGNGTYAFIVGIGDPSLLPTYCSLITAGWGLGFASNEGDVYFYAHLHNLPDGTPATLTFVSAVPSLNYLGFDGSTSENVGNNFPGDADFYNAIFETEGPVLVTLNVTAADCSADLQINVGEIAISED